MKNKHFNLLNQLVQTQKSLWRIENHYLPESTTAAEKKFWEKLKTQKTKNIAEMSKLAKKAL